MDVEVKLEGLTGILGKLASLSRAGDTAVDEALLETATLMQEHAQKTVKETAYDTGTLFRRIAVEKSENGYTVGTNLEYAPYVEYGTGLKGDPTVPHTRRRYWRYQDENGNWHTSTGMKARPFLRPAAAKYKTYLPKLVRKKIWDKMKSPFTGGRK